MKVLLKRLVVGALVVGAVGGGYTVFFKGGGKNKKDEVKYETGKAAVQDVRSFVTATGVIQPWKVVDVKSNVAGRIDRLYVDLGDTVTAGQTIADIDPTDTTTAFEQADADLQAATARRQQAEFSVRQQKIQARARIAGAQKSVETAKARLVEMQSREAEAKANRDVQPSLTTLAISQATAAHLSAEKSVLQARQTRQQLEEQLRQLKQVSIPFNVRTANSNVSQARANMLTAEREYRRQRELLAQGFVAQSDVDAAYARLATMKSTVETTTQRQKTMTVENELLVKELEARIAAAQSNIEEAEARVKQARAAVDLAQAQSVQNEVRSHAYAAAQASVRQADANVKQAEAELDGARAEEEAVRVREKEIKSAEAQIVRSEAAIRQARQNRSYTRIVAPRAGVVTAKNVEEGTVVPSSRASIGSTNAMLQIGDVSQLWVVCNVDETDIGQVAVDQKVTVKVDAFPSMLIEGKVIRINPQAIVEQNVTLVPVTVQLDMPDPRFKPGMNATCEFIVDEALNVLTVPNEALKEEAEGSFFVQVMQNGKPQKTEVQVGLAGADVTEVREGLKDGTEVVTRTIEPEKAEKRNPFNPFGGFGRSSSRSSSGGSGRGGGGSGGGSGGGGRGGR